MGYLIIWLDKFAARLKFLSGVNADYSVGLKESHSYTQCLFKKYAFVYSSILALKYWFNLLLNSKCWDFRPSLLFLLPKNVQDVDILQDLTY